MEGRKAAVIGGGVREERGEVEEWKRSGKAAVERWQELALVW